jgi:hypothetical protein
MSSHPFLCVQSFSPMEFSNTMLNMCLFFLVHTAYLTICYSPDTEFHIHVDKYKRTPSPEVTNRVPWSFFVYPTNKKALKRYFSNVQEFSDVKLERDGLSSHLRHRFVDWEVKIVSSSSVSSSPYVSHCRWCVFISNLAVKIWSKQR